MCCVYYQFLYPGAWVTLNRLRALSDAYATCLVITCAHARVMTYIHVILEDSFYCLVDLYPVCFNASIVPANAFDC
jgi:hypothetical protein